MAEILIKAIDESHPDPVKDQRGCYKRGMPCIVRPDGHPWGKEERLPKFVVIKVPGISVAQLTKYAAEHKVIDAFTGKPVTMRRRRWQIQWSELPAIARNRLANTGTLTIKAGTYAGTFDYTWTQVKGFFLDQATGLRETTDPTAG